MDDVFFSFDDLSEEWWSFQMAWPKIQRDDLLWRKRSFLDPKYEQESANNLKSSLTSIGYLLSKWIKNILDSWKRINILFRLNVQFCVINTKSNGSLFGMRWTGTAHGLVESNFDQAYCWSRQWWLRVPFEFVDEVFLLKDLSKGSSVVVDFWEVGSIMSFRQNTCLFWPQGIGQGV